MTKKKLTIKDLIDAKDKFLEKKKETKDVYLEELDAVVTIDKPTRSLIIESREMESDEFLVYNVLISPNLKDKGLQEEYGCVEPDEIVSKIFDLGTVTGIAMEAMDLAGMNSKVTPVDELKN